VYRTNYLRSLAHLFDSNYPHTILLATRTLRICLFTGVLVESRFALQCLLASKVSYYPYAYSIHLCKNHVLLTNNLLIRYFGVWTGSHNSLTMTRISKILTLCANYKDTWSFLPNLEASASRLSRLSDDSAKFLSSLKSLRKLSNLISVSMQPNSWVTHISWHEKVKSNTPMYLAFNNQSSSPHTLETSNLDHLHLNALSRSPYVPYNL